MAKYSVDQIEAAKKRQKKCGGTLMDNLMEVSGEKPMSVSASIDDINNMLARNSEDINATIRELQKIFEINDSLEVINNPFLELFDIRKVVFRSIEWDEMAGQQGLQKFVIYASSDQDFFADLTEKEKIKTLY